MSESETIKKEIRELEKQREQAKVKLSAAVQAVNQSKEEEANLVKNIKKSQKELDLLTARNEVLTKQIVDNKSTVENGEQEVKQITKSLAPLRLERDNLLKEKTGIEKELIDKRAKAKAEADTLIAEAGKKVALAEKKVADSKTDIEAMQSAVDKASRDYKDTILKESELAKKITESKGVLEKILADIVKSEQTLAVKNQSVMDLDKRIGQIKDTITLLEKDTATMTDLRNTAENKLKGVQAELNKATMEWETTKIKLFGISERENQLKQSYLYIKERYKEAGIAFAEIEGI